MSNTSVQRLIVKGTSDELPQSKTGSRSPLSPLWEAVAAEAKDNAGRWVAFSIPGRDSKNLGSARTNIKTGKYRSFATGAWDAAVRGETLYVKFLGEETPEVVNFKKAEVA